MAGDPERSLAALGTAESIRKDLGRIDDPDLSVCLSHVSATRTKEFDADDAVSSSGIPSSSGMAFRILRLHAEGGLGQVFVAYDGELSREVALKKIMSDHSDDEESRKRFLLEAEVTGRLEHPGIVPVYSLGTDSDRKPFYAMRFVKGDRLKDAIERLHKSDWSSKEALKERRLTLRNLLNRLVAVCNAVAYAHSRGVLHRDLKPSNILLGPYGETLLVDWGLAKVVGREEPKSAGGEATLRPSSSSGSGETQPGSAIGTPAYMSPEQAESKHDRLGPGTDVYGLGATLYCLLTGHAPFEGGDVPATLEKVRSGRFPRPREINPSVPPDLEAVCLKAMSLRPEDRYGSARELAEEIERSQADEPVLAYRERLTRLARSGRRNRLKVVAAMTLLLASVVALSIGIILIDRERRATSLEQGRTKQALAQAEDNYRMAIEVADRYFYKVSEDGLLNEPVMDRLRADLLALARDFYTRIVEHIRRTIEEKGRSSPTDQSESVWHIYGWRSLARTTRNQ